MRQQVLLNKTSNRQSPGNQCERTLLARPIRFTLVSITLSMMLGFSAALSGCSPESSDSSSPSAPPTADVQPTEPAPDSSQTVPPQLQTPSSTGAENSPSAPVDDASNADGVADGSAQLPSTVETSVFQDIARNNNVSSDALEIEAAVPQSWPDGCLGLGGPDDICTFAIVDGWEVTVSQGDRAWVYRTDRDGLVVAEDLDKRG